MNNEIRHLYNNLDVDLRQQARRHFQNAPKMLYYLELLEEQDELVTTNKAVAHIYKEASSSVARSTLINRFYKLRHKLRLWLLSQLRDHTICLTQEEQELAFLRWMVIKNEYQYAYEQLLVLEKSCWERNLFELLPDVLTLLQRCAVSCELWDVATEIAYIEKIDLANDLLHLLRRLKNQLFYLKTNLEDYQKVLERTRRRIKPYKAYPRFALFYHHMAFMMGIYLPDLVQHNSHVLKRHLNSFRKLQRVSPDIPIIDFEPFHLERFETSFYVREAVFWYYKGDFKKCHKAIQQREATIQSNTSFYPERSESTLHNLIYFCLAAQAYEEALYYAQQLKEFQGVNWHEADAPYFLYQMLAYIQLYPQKLHPNPLHLVQRVDLFLKSATKDTVWACISLAEFCLLYGEVSKAVAILQHPLLPAYYSQYSLSFFTEELATHVQTQNRQGLQQLLVTLGESLKQTTESKVRFHYETTLKIAQQLLKRLKQ